MKIEDLNVGDMFVLDGDMITIVEMLSRTSKVGPNIRTTHPRSINGKGLQRFSYEYLNEKDIICYTPEAHPERFL